MPAGFPDPDYEPHEWKADGECNHHGAFEVDNGSLYCPACQTIVAIPCSGCGGAGHVEEDEYHCDYINYGPNLIMCPDCGGTGWDWD